jgi:hypothetical protein
MFFVTMNEARKVKILGYYSSEYEDYGLLELDIT